MPGKNVVGTTHAVYVPLSKELKEKLQKHCQRQGIPLSTFLNQKIVEIARELPEPNENP